MRRPRLPATVLLGACLLAAGLGCEECPLIRQTLVVVDPDDEVLALADACRRRQAAPGERSCGPPPSTGREDISCGCRALCQRVLMITDDFPGPESLQKCSMVDVPSVDGGPPGIEVLVTYRPSRCGP